MATINLGNSVSLKQFADAIATVGDQVTVIGQGEPGIGKSAMLNVLANQFPEYATAYIDCTLLDLGDFALPFTVEENGIRITKFAPNARFQLQSDKPVIVMLDEIGKAMKAVKNVLLTLMLEHRIGDMTLPKGSIVFGTTNLSSDGVGDSLEAHARNRVCFVTVRKPHAGFNADGTVDEDSWGLWALDNDIDPVVLAWVRANPHCLESYTDPAQRENGLIFQPTRPEQIAFVSPRSLHKASNIVKKRGVLGADLTQNLLAGTIGQQAAAEMQAFIMVVDKLPTWEAIVQDPKNAKVPSDMDVVAKCLIVLSALTRVDDKSIDAWIDYAERLDLEWQAMFAKSGMKSNKQKILVRNDKFKKWAIKNQWAF